jgi:histone deacetylase 6
MRGNNVLDENLIFGLIGIADSIQQLAYGSVVLSPTGSYYAGDYTSYSLLFKTTNTIPEGSYMILTLDPVFILAPFPACQSPPLNAQIIGGNIFC